MQGLTLFAAIVGTIPVLAFLAVLWFSGGAPLHPVDLVPEVIAVPGSQVDS